MTARVTSLKGADAGVYYVEALPSYYLDSDEPPGRWRGRGADLLGLRGEVVEGDFLEIMAGVRPGSGGATLGRSYGDDSVRGFDVTASAPKSVSTLFALGDAFVRAEVLAAHDVAVGAMVDWVESHAHTRFRIDGNIAVVDADGIVAATFRQHTSRALDPQLHTHVVVANRVRSPDGRWLALDARTLMLDQRTLSAIYHATLRTQLTANLGVRWRPVENGIAEIADIPLTVLEEFSARTGDIARRVDEKLDRFIDTFEREPTPRERWRLEREAVIDSRPAKTHGINAAALHQQWATQVADLGLDPVRVVEGALGSQRLKRLTAKVRDEVIDAAMASLVARQSSWRPAELTREIAAALPPSLSINPRELPAIVDSLTARAIRDRCVDISRPVPEGAILRRDGRPLSESVAHRALTTQAILAEEGRALEWAQRRMSHIPADSTDAPKRADVPLSVAQAQTAGAVAGDAHLVLVVGPAGTGKTTALRPAVGQLHAEGRAVFGVAPSAAAAQVLGVETGVAADTIDKLLTEHNLNRPPSHTYDLPTGATVIVDEAGMVPTATLDQLATLADTKGWRVALVGDPMQFSAVGRGGMYQHLIDTHGAIELDRVHRFSGDWEADASLRLRRGDPAVADEYDLHGRLHGGTTGRMHTEALDAWWAARRAGEEVVLAAPTNDTVAVLNRAGQQRRIDTGDLDTRGRHADTGGCRMWPGDEVATRHNDRQLTTDQGLMVRNRDRWVIDTVHRNGDLTLTGNTGTARLPAHYVQHHVELAYAQTSHATQGRTVDRSILVLDSACDVRGIYVPMTRGRHHNDAFIVTTGEQTAAGVFAEAIGRSWIDQPAHTRRAELAGHGPQRPGTIAPDKLRGLFERAASLTNTLEALDEDLKYLPKDWQRTRTERDEVKEKLAELAGELQEAFDTVARYDKPLRRRGNEIRISNARVTIRVLPDIMRERHDTIQELGQQLDDIDRRWRRAEHANQRRPQLNTELADLNRRIRDDHRIRTRQHATNPQTTVVKALGSRPPGGERARLWDIAAAHLDQHNAAYPKTGAKPAQTPGYQLSTQLLRRARRALDTQDQVRRRELSPPMRIR